MLKGHSTVKYIPIGALRVCLHNPMVLSDVSLSSQDYKIYLYVGSTQSLRVADWYMNKHGCNLYID